MINNLALITGLIILGAIDFITKRLPFPVIGLWGVLAVFIQVYQGNLFCQTRLIAIIPGILLFVLARVTGEKIGYGDAWVLLIMGIYMDADKLLAAGMIAISISGIAALILITFCKKKMNYEMPFIPFLLVGCVAEQMIYMSRL